MAIFPDDQTGRFFSSSLTVGMTYNVHGKEADVSTNSATATSPFGSYTAFTAPLPRPHPPPSRNSSGITKRKLIKKSILLATLSLQEQGTSSSKSKLQYEVVTQIIVSLDPTLGHCCVKAVCDKVKDQVRFEVVLLDSKCYPITANEITSDPEYWKGTRKVIAAHRGNYEKLGGISPETDLLKCMEDLDSGDQGETKEQTKKRRRGKGKKKESVAYSDILKRLDSIDRKLTLLDGLKKALECCICKYTCNRPVVVRCCGRIIGCSSCVEQWLVNEVSCPLCRVTGQMVSKIQLKGFEEVVAFFRMVESPHSEIESQEDAQVIAVDESESDDDFEQQPLFRTPTSTST